MSRYIAKLSNLVNEHRIFLCLCQILSPYLLLINTSNDPGNRGSISGRVIPMTQKAVLDTSLLNTQHYKERFKDKVEQSRERISTLPYTSV